MSRVIIALNAGSSSFKVGIHLPQSDVALATFLVDRIGPDGELTVKIDGKKQSISGEDLSTHGHAMLAIAKQFEVTFTGLEIAAIGHRVVHGGDFYDRSVLVTNDVLFKLETLSPFAPLHQPHNIEGIRIAMHLFPDIPQVACFDTAFHRSHPWVNDTFALPREFYDEGIRRYGFHGLSYEYITDTLSKSAPHLSEGKVVVAHLGNGASMCAIQNGQSVASTMGFSALDGLPMGTRCGQLDAGVMLYLIDQKGMSAHEISDLLYKKSGLLGLSGLSNDMRTLEASRESSANEAIDYFVFRSQREVGAMAAAMGGIDALVFCGGIGENSHFIRARICERLHWMGIEINHERNQQNATVISSDLSRTTAMVIPTNEETMIIRATCAILNSIRPIP
jgi:acetate kinase